MPGAKLDLWFQGFGREGVKHSIYKCNSLRGYTPGWDILGRRKNTTEIKECLQKSHIKTQQLPYRFWIPNKNLCQVKCLAEVLVERDLRNHTLWCMNKETDYWLTTLIAKASGYHSPCFDVYCRFIVAKGLILIYITQQYKTKWQKNKGMWKKVRIWPNTYILWSFGWHPEIIWRLNLPGYFPLTITQMCLNKDTGLQLGEGQSPKWQAWQELIG